MQSRYRSGFPHLWEGIFFPIILLFLQLFSFSVLRFLYPGYACPGDDHGCAVYRGSTMAMRRNCTGDFRLPPCWQAESKHWVMFYFQFRQLSGYMKRLLLETYLILSQCRRLEISPKFKSRDSSLFPSPPPSDIIVSKFYFQLTVVCYSCCLRSVQDGDSLLFFKRYCLFLREFFKLIFFRTIWVRMISKLKFYFF